ncbi:MAG: lipoate--protein ligase family protein [Nitrospiraceae bacterium]|nr:lipoate--protein ligase family protein [Nitrospiraceae bacterium]
MNFEKEAENFFRVIDSGACGAAFNMALDEALAISVREAGLPAIRFYGWERPALSLGRFQKDKKGFHSDFIRESGLPVVVRPTGGRAVLHLPGELTYSVSSRFEGAFRGKNLFECYGIISSAISRALGRLGADVEVKLERRGGPAAGISAGQGGNGKNAHCFQCVSYAEITSGGRKLVGSAQRRWPDGFLQQGSIPFEIDGPLQGRIFRGFDPLAMSGLNEIVPGPADRSRETLKRYLTEEFRAVLGVDLLAAAPARRERALARDLLPAYESSCF